MHTILQMPAVAAAALMEYSGLGLRVGSIVGARRDVELRLDDLEGLAQQLAGDFEVFIAYFSPLRCIPKLLELSRLRVKNRLHFHLSTTCVTLALSYAPFDFLTRSTHTRTHSRPPKGQLYVLRSVRIFL